MLDHEEFRRCESCGEADFIVEKLLTIPKILKKRESTNVPLEGVETEYKYSCAFCGTVIDI